MIYSFDCSPAYYRLKREEDSVERSILLQAQVYENDAALWQAAQTLRLEALPNKFKLETP